MHRTSKIGLKRQRARTGFTLTELLVVLAIMGVLAGMAVLTFVGVSRNLRVASAAETINQALLNARQQAITSRTPRRVAINLLNNEFYTERRVADSQTNKANEVWLRSTNPEALSKYVWIADVGGFTEAYFDSNPGVERVWYVEFDQRGRAVHYPAGATTPILGNIAFHIVLENTLIPISDDREVTYEEILDSASLKSLVSSMKVKDDNHDDIDDGSGLPMEIAASARSKVATVYVLALTGRSYVFEYGYGYPWSEEDVEE